MKFFQPSHRAVKIQTRDRILQFGSRHDFRFEKEALLHLASATFLESFAAAAKTRIIAPHFRRRTGLKYHACGRRWSRLRLTARRNLSLVEARPPTHLRFNIRDHPVSVFQESQACFFPAGESVLDIFLGDVSRLDIPFFVGAADLVHDLLRPETRASGGEAVPDHGRLRLEDVEQPVKIRHRLLTVALDAQPTPPQSMRAKNFPSSIMVRLVRTQIPIRGPGECFPARFPDLKEIELTGVTDSPHSIAIIEPEN